jgi:hypothetical protein
VKNKLTDLNDHLFAQLERLSDEDLTPEQIHAEVKRGGAIVAVADAIVQNANTQLKAINMIAVHGDRFKSQLPMIEQKSS